MKPKNRSRILISTLMMAGLAFTTPEADAGPKTNWLKKKISWKSSSSKGSGSSSTSGTKNKSKVTYGTLPSAPAQPRSTNQRTVANGLLRQSPQSVAPIKPPKSAKTNLSLFRNNNNSQAQTQPQQSTFWRPPVQNRVPAPSVVRTPPPNSNSTISVGANGRITNSSPHQLLPRSPGQAANGRIPSAPKPNSNTSGAQQPRPILNRLFNQGSGSSATTSTGRTPPPPSGQGANGRGQTPPKPVQYSSLPAGNRQQQPATQGGIFSGLTGQNNRLFNGANSRGTQAPPKPPMNRQNNNSNN